MQELRRSWDADVTFSRCNRLRECGQRGCMFFERSDHAHCWQYVSPFKLRRRPSLLLKDTAERCECLSILCQQCQFFDPKED